MQSAVALAYERRRQLAIALHEPDPIVSYAEKLATFEIHAAALQARLASSRLFDDNGELSSLRAQIAATTMAITVAGHATLSACRDRGDLLPR